jgi:hypothetical protein
MLLTVSIIVLIISVFYYQYLNDFSVLHYFTFLIPSELKGWIIMSIVTPIMTSMVSTRNFTYWFQKIFLYSHIWDSQIGGNNFLEWFSFYLIKNKHFTITK